MTGTLGVVCWIGLFGCRANGDADVGAKELDPDPENKG
jgi:hypothetical protein